MFGDLFPYFYYTIVSVFLNSFYKNNIPRSMVGSNLHKNSAVDEIKCINTAHSGNLFRKLLILLRLKTVVA
jgi:hypothetical protein